MLSVSGDRILEFARQHCRPPVFDSSSGEERQVQIDRHIEWSARVRLCRALLVYTGVVRTEEEAQEAIENVADLIEADAEGVL